MIAAKRERNGESYPTISLANNRLYGCRVCSHRLTEFMRRSVGSSAAATAGTAGDRAADPAHCYTDSGEPYHESLVVRTGPDRTENY
jgi:hypothetical protein